jgi:hypothetical protein
VTCEAQKASHTGEIEVWGGGARQNTAPGARCEV